MKGWPYPGIVGVVAMAAMAAGFACAGPAPADSKPESPRDRPAAVGTEDLVASVLVGGVT